MRSPVDERLAREAAQFSFRHTCESCCHFDGNACGDGWPTREHRLPIAREGLVVFCKEFEIA